MSIHYVDLTIANNNPVDIIFDVLDLKEGTTDVTTYTQMTIPWPTVRFSGSRADIERVVKNYGSENDIQIQEF